MDNPYQASVPTTFVMEGGTASVPTVDALSRTRPWVRICAIVAFVFAAAMILMGIMIIATGSLIGIPQGIGPMGGFVSFMGIINILMSLLYLIPGIKLWSYGNSIRNLAMSRSNTDLQAALEQHRVFWKFVGIMIIATFLLVVISILAIVILGFGAAMSMSPSP